MMSAHSRRRAFRSGFSGQGNPVMSSLSLWPLPSASHSRSGNISGNVAVPCARTRDGTCNLAQR